MTIRTLPLILAFGLLLTNSCGNSEKNDSASTEITTNSNCKLAIEGMMCEKGCKSTIESRVSEKEGVTECKVDYEAKTASIDYDNSVTSCDDIIETINTMVDGQYKATLIEKKNVTPDAANDDMEQSGADDEMSVSNYDLDLPSLTDAFTNLI